MTELKWSPAGDGRFCILSHFNPLSGTQRYSRDQISGVDGKFRAAFDLNSALWVSRDLDDERAAMSGQAVFIESDLAGAFLALDLNHQQEAARDACARLVTAMQTALADCPETGLLDALVCTSADALIFESGQISVAVHFLLPDGWSGHTLPTLFGGDCRNKVTKAFCEAVPELYNDIIDNLRRELTVERKKLRVRDNLGNDLNWNGEKAVLIQSLNIIFAGALPPDPPPASAPLDERLRGLIYAPGPGPVTSQSPRLDEFVFLGYAFNIIVADAPDRRMREMALIIRLMHALFNQLGGVSREVQSYLLEDRIARLAQIRALKRRVRSQYDQLRSPTFTFRHEMLVFRDHIFREWFLDRELAHAEHLIDALIAHEQARETRTRNRFSAAVSVLLFAIALMSLISVAADFRTLTGVNPMAIPALNATPEEVP